MPGYILVVCLVIARLTDVCTSENYDISDNIIRQLGNNDLNAVQEQLLSILDRLTSLDERYNIIDSRITGLDQRISSLDHRITGLDERMNAQDVRIETRISHLEDKVLQHSRAVCSEGTESPTGRVTLGPATSAEPETSTGSQSSTETDTEIPLRITRVTKTEIDESYRLNVEYEASVQPQVLLLDIEDDIFKEMKPQPDMGMVTLEVPKNASYSSSDYRALLLLQFVLPDTYVMARFRPYSTSDSMDVPSFQFRLLQGRSITFKRGTKPKLDYTLKTEGNTDDVDDEDVDGHILVKSDTEEHVVNAYSSYIRDRSSDIPVMLEKIEEGGTKGDRYGTFVVNSTRGDVEGLIEIVASIEFNCSRNCLLSRMYLAHKRVKFYREDHDGPFPNDLIAFVNNDMAYDEDTFRFFCNINARPGCGIHCTAIGLDQIPTLELSRSGTNQGTKPARNTTQSRDIWISQRLDFANASLADAGDFLCTAKTQTREITHKISLIVYKAPTIDKQASDVTKFENGSALAVCVAEGIPAPNVTFNNEHTPLNDYSPSDYHASLEFLDDTTTRAEVFISDPDMLFNVYYFQCVASVEPATGVRRTDETYMYVDP